MVVDLTKLPKIIVWSDWCCLLAVSSQTFVIFTFKILLVNGKSFFQKVQRHHTNLLMSFSSISNMVVDLIKLPKSLHGVTGEVCLLFQSKLMLYSLSKYYWSMENHFFRR